MLPEGARCIFVTLAGSHAHGTASPASDLDLRGVCIAPLDLRLSLFDDFEQHEGEPPPSLGGPITRFVEQRPELTVAARNKLECVVYDIAKFVRLCTNANPNALEILFADRRDWVLSADVWLDVHRERHRFLSAKVRQTFHGYAMSQLARIKTHRAWLLNPPAAKPTRQAFGLPESETTLANDDRNRIEQAITDHVRRYGIDDIEMPAPSRLELRARLSALHTDLLEVEPGGVEPALRDVAVAALQLPGDVVSALRAEKRYRAAKKQWDAYASWKRSRNPARAALEQTHGYDTKHAMHLVRLMRMGLEALRTGELAVRRDDADELVAIRSGALSFDELLDRAHALSGEFETAVQASSLPPDVDRDWADELVRALVLRVN